MKLKLVSILLAFCTTAGSMTMPAFAERTQAAQIESESNMTAQENGSAKEQEWEGYTYKELTDNTLEITGYKGTDTALTIPDKIEDKPVTGIGRGAFAGLEKVESITIPEGITNIGSSAFQRCGSLKNIVIPEGVTVIDEYIFAYSAKLESVTLPESVTTIKEGAFGECRSLKSISIPKNVDSIPDYAFTYCESLAQVRFPEGLTYIGENAFSGCKSLPSVEFPNSLKDIDYFAFQNCTTLSNVTFPENLENIGRDAFLGCESLQNVEFHEGLIRIGEGAFRSCSKLESLTLPLSLTEIWKGAFTDCNSLKTVNYAGSKTDRSNMRIIGEGNAPLLQSKITYGSTGKSEDFAPKKGSQLKDNGVTYQVKTDVSELAFVKTIDKASKIKISDSVKIDGICYTVASITKNAFLNNKNITKVTIHRDVKSIGKSAFKGCSKLKKIVIQSHILESVGSNAFKGIHSSAVIKVPDLNLNDYKKIMKNKGQGSKVKIVAL